MWPWKKKGGFKKITRPDTLAPIGGAQTLSHHLQFFTLISYKVNVSRSHSARMAGPAVVITDPDHLGHFTVGLILLFGRLLKVFQR